MKIGHTVIAAAALCSSTIASAAPLMLYPVQTDTEMVRFRQGIPTLDLETPSGGVLVTPLPFDHGHVTFGIAVYNKTQQPANFGIENVTATIEGTTVPILSVDDLQKSAKSRAMWTQIGIAVLAGAAAGVAAGAHTTDHYHSSLRTPHGVYSWNASYRDNSLGVLGATAATAGGVAGIVGVQNRLDYTLANLSEDIVQTTTIDAEASYGGRIVLEKPKVDKTPYDVRLLMNWNGTPYLFVFRVTKQGVAVPPAYSASTFAMPATPSSPIQPAPAAVSPIAAPAGATAPPGTSDAAQTSTPPTGSTLSNYDAGRRAGQAAIVATTRND